MTFHFAKLETIDPLLAAIEGMPELKVTEHHEHGYGFIMYMVAFEETFLDPLATDDPVERARRALLREARGIKYDLKTRKIISRPYHKFFNVNERLETQAAAIDWTLPHVVLEKLDGSMLTPLVSYPSGKLLMMTKRGVTEISMKAQGFLDANPHYAGFCLRMIHKRLTPIFEWCSRSQRIIIDYGPKDRLVLTAIRDNVTGDYFRYDDMVGIAQDNDLDYVRKLDFTVTDVNKFLDHTRAIQDEEGYIVRFDDGHMYKVKGEWYCRLHKTFDTLRFEKDVIRLLLEGMFDDIRPFLVPSMLSAVDRFNTDMRANLQSRAQSIFDYVEEARSRHPHKGSFVDEVNADAEWFPFCKFLFRTWSNNWDVTEIFNQLVRDILKYTFSQTQVDDHRHLFGNLNWLDYLSVPEE